MAKKKITKEIIQSSITFLGIGHPKTKTIFNIKNDYEKTNFRFAPLTKISGRTLTICFSYKENDVESFVKLPLTIVKSEDENEIKEFILEAINTHLSN